MSEIESEQTVSEELQFVYRKELWFANLIINSTQIDMKTIVHKLKEFLVTKLKNLTKQDIPNCAWSNDLQKKVLEIAKHLTLTISWNPVLLNFPFQVEKLTYNQAGFLEFDVEYFKGNLERKRQLKPWILHEVPIFILTQLKEYFTQIDYVIVDKDPMYMVAIADRTEERGLRVEVPWTNIEMERQKKCIFQWISLYSGRWDDFRDSYLENTVEGNLAYRKSELHYIRDESAFFYIAESDFNEFFESYYKSRIIRTIGEIRAFQNAIIAVNKSIDELKTNINTAAYFKLENVTLTLSKLEYLVGVVDSRISEIKNDLESNRYRYYKKVLLHLVEIMDIEQLSEQLQSKISQISESLQNRYRKIQQVSQEQLEKSTFFLNILFGLGLFTDIVALGVTFVFALFGDPGLENTIILLLSGIFGSICLILIFYITHRIIRLRKKDSGKNPMRTVDAVIIDDNNRILLIKRRWEPFKGAYALPGGFIELAEEHIDALVRETREETGVELQYGEMQFIKVFDDKNRDPRGPVHSYAYLCRVDDIEERTRNYHDKGRLLIIHINDLKDFKLAFDHRYIIKAALKRV
ncbi:MAG: NUDIX hydrolase [Candidatus Lokiarchaeota archaeon]|nr:NUDIX hydrolase [Candidatus Lokiarchaeota archaeon]